jgi:predicted small metal-binding protein
VAKRFECRNVVPGCEAVVEAGTVEEVMEAVAGHAAQAHGMTSLPEAVIDQVRTGITES